MIKIIDDYSKIVPLWQEAFGDSEEDILFFADNCVNKKCIAYFNEECLASMLFLVDCKCSGNDASYIYAACTLKSMQGKGYMTKLIDYSIANYGNVCLIPASDSLINYYKDRGFTFCHDIEALSFDESKEIQEYLLEGYMLTKPVLLADFN